MGLRIPPWGLEALSTSHENTVLVESAWEFAAGPDDGVQKFYCYCTEEVLQC